jgi:hypothetical protein
MSKRITLRYLPKKLTKNDREKQTKMLLKSRKLYKEGKYYIRDQVNSFKSKPSKYVSKARKIYKIPKNKAVSPKTLSKPTKCSKKALEQIVKKGEGAYYSSGSRPNQTAQSWGIARLASAVTAGKAAAVDYSILKKGCKPTSPALKRANIAKKKHNRGQRRVPKTKIK